MMTHKLRLAIVSLLIALPLIGVSQAAAQDQDFTPELYTSELSGFDVEVAGPQYEITSAVIEHYATGEGELVGIEGEYATIEVSFFDDEDTPEDSIDAYLNGLESSDLDYTELDRGVDGDITYSVVLIHYEGVDVLYYMQVTEDVTGNVDLFETILTLPEILETDLGDAQEEIAIDGTPFMDNVDGEELLAVLEDGGTGDDTTTPEATSVPEEDEGSSAAATTLPIGIADVELSISEDFESYGEPISETGIEGHALTTGDINLVVAVGETGVSPADMVTSFQGGFEGTFADAEVLESVDDDDVAWTLLYSEATGEPRLLLIVADTTTTPGFETLVAMEMPADDPAASIELVQEGLSIDGQALLADIDADEVTAAAENADTTDDADVTPEATEEDTDSDTGTEDDTDSSDPRDDAKLPGTDDSDSNTSETDPTETDETTEPTEEPSGQSGDSNWVSPVYGVDISWDSSVWTTDLEDPEFVESDEADGYEFLMLTSDSTLLYFEFYDDSHTTGEFLEEWTSEEYLNHATSTGSDWEGELLSSRNRDGAAGVVIRYTTESGEYMMIREAVELSDGTILVTTLDAETAGLGIAHEEAQGGVTVNSEPVLNLFSTSQIDRLIED